MQTLLNRIKRSQHLEELLPSKIQQNDPINDSSLSSSSVRSTNQYQNDKLLAVSMNILCQFSA